MLFGLAHELHRSVAELEQLSHRELQGWLTYFSELNQRRPAAMRDVADFGPGELDALMGRRLQ